MYFSKDEREQEVLTLSSLTCLENLYEIKIIYGHTLTNLTDTEMKVAFPELRFLVFYCPPLPHKLIHSDTIPLLN